MSLWINESEEGENCVTVDKSVSKMYRVNVLENVINRQRRKEGRRRTVSTFIEKRDKSELKKIFVIFQMDKLRVDQ